MRDTTKGILVAVMLVTGLWATPAVAKHGRPADRVEPPARVSQERFAEARFDDRMTRDEFNACERVTVGNAAMQQCLSAARAFRGSAVPAIQACGQAMVGNDATVRCIEYASRARFQAVATVRACQRAMVGNEATLQCIAVAARSFRDPVPIVRLCKRASIGNARTLGCIDRALFATARR